MVRADKKLSDMDPCNAIIGSMPPDLAMAYWTEKGSSHFPVCVQTLIEDLTPKEVMVNTQKAKLEKYKSNVRKSNNGDPRNKFPGAATTMGRVPRKTLQFGPKRTQMRKSADFAKSALCGPVDQKHTQYQWV